MAQDQARKKSPAEVFPALWRELEHGTPGPVYLLYGPREERDLSHVQYLFDRTVAVLRKRFASDPAGRFNQDLFVGGQTGLDQVLGSARTMPMFGDRRLTVVVDQGEPTDKETESIVAYVRDPVPTTTLMIVFGTGKLSRKIHNACKSADCLYRAERLKDREVVRWIEECFRSHGLATAPGAALTVSEYTGVDLAAIEDTVEKLVIYTSGRGVVQTEDVEQCVLAVRQSEIFDLLDSIGERNAGKALTILERLGGQRTESLFINAMLSRTIRNLIKIRSHAKLPGRNDVAQDLKVHPFVAGKLIDQARNFSMRDLERALAASAEFNVRSKRSRVPHERLLEEMVVRIISSQDV